jgi:dTDP-glucose 4,6-dehydratase
MDATRMRNELGWKPAHSFERGLADTVGWYLKNKEWWTRVMTGEYLDYYRKQYSDA